MAERKSKLMRKFIVNVNGTAYDVEVEEVGAGAASAPVAAAPAAAPKAAAAPKPAAAPKAAAAPAGAVNIAAPMPGNIMAVNVKVGDSVTKGQVVAVLEAMKMENEIMAPQAGKVVAVHASKGATVNTGDVLVSLG